MSYLPCKNTSCKSYGRPHPNCRCYGELAEGGDVLFCSASHAHNPECEYFAEGGPVGALSHEDPFHSISGHIANSGLLGMLRMDNDGDIEKYEKSVHRGHKSLDSEFEKIFQEQKQSPLEDRSKHHERIEDWVSKGGMGHHIQEEIYAQNIPAEHFAKGGAVGSPPEGVLNNHPIEHVYPSHNIVLQDAKNRISNYLGALMPKDHAAKLAFDDNPDQTKQRKSFDKALKLADSPLSILHEVANGTMDAEHLIHLKALYPELYETMQKKMTEKIIHSQLSGKKPSSKVRQSLSILMGVPLSSGLTPQGIMAAQATFNVKNPESQLQQTNKPTQKTSILSKSDDSFLTNGQARVMRQQRIS